MTVGAAADIGALKVEKSGAVDVSGAVSSIESKESDMVTLDGAIVFPGSVAISKGTGGLEICSSTIEGEVKVTGTEGNIAVGITADGDNCGASTIDGTVSVEKGTGDVSLVGGELTAGDLIVIEQTGDVTVDGILLSDVKVEKITGHIMLLGIETDSDTTVADNEGDVTIAESMLGSDVSIISNLAVAVTDSNFSFEDVFVGSNAGPVVLDRNTDLNVAIIENNAVTVTNNTFTDADISKNTGGVFIDNNGGEVLKCFDNNPAPTGSGNTITELADGQCAGF